MTYKKFNAFCSALTSTTHVVQWGGSHVWKVGGKVFAIGGWQDDEPSFTFKVSEISYEVLKDLPGLRPAPYLASRGMTWIQHFTKPGLSDVELRIIFADRISSSRAACPRRSRSSSGSSSRSRMPAGKRLLGVHSPFYNGWKTVAELRQGS